MSVAWQFKCPKRGLLPIIEVQLRGANHCHGAFMMLRMLAVVSIEHHADHQDVGGNIDAHVMRAIYNRSTHIGNLHCAKNSCRFTSVQIGAVPFALYVVVDRAAPVGFMLKSL